ncbi:MAG: hypothetical protein JSV44_11070 [Candidatus Zixiibacteriota bacterium]|nr:MAG: hypothetical protein JSV44_11070 [candidate division Zixibacteria bacterium]
MNFNIRRPYLFLLLSAIFVAGLLAAFRYLHAFQLDAVSIAPERFAGHADKLALESGKNVFSLPINAAIDCLLKRHDVLRVELDYDLPDGIAIRVNEAVPVALAVGGGGRTLFSLDEFGYRYRFDPIKNKLDYPIITGLKDCREYERADDLSLGVILRQLARLKEDDMDSYLAVTTIDLLDQGDILVYLDGVRFPLITYPGKLCRSIMQLKVFILGIDPDLDQIKKLDLRSDELIIAVK